jgi:tryptophan halogenase
MKKTICIIGSGTAGWIAASYIKSSLGELVDIKLVYDHNQPVIGVGESTTPLIMDYLRVIGITHQELIKSIGATIKFAVKFTDWNGDGKHYYHAFTLLTGIPPHLADRNLIAGHEIANSLDTGGETYSSYMCDNLLVPVDNQKELAGNFALHIDGYKFSEFIRDRFKDRVEIIDDKITSVNVKDGNIESLTGEKIGNITADMYIDASGLNQALMKELNNQYISKSDYLCMDSAFPVYIPLEKNSPPYTEAVATKNGWIWKIPLAGRFGSGYVFSSKFTTNEAAREDYKKHIFENHGVEVVIPENPIRFNPGYWKEQWKGNCVTFGLSSGFVEPLEATAIHMIINQVRMFCGCWEMNPTEWSRKNYNNLVAGMYEQTFDFIRLHYHTKREDSDLWKFFKENRPEWLIDYSDKCRKSMITTFDVYNDWDRILSPKIFGLAAYTRVSYGLEMFNSVAVKNWLSINGYADAAKEVFDYIEKEKNSAPFTYIKHDTFLKLNRD